MITFQTLERLAEVAPQYRALRKAHPAVKAADVHSYVRAGGDGQTLEQFLCRHEWAFTGTQYGGDDEAYGGEGRAYCSRCGVDGDG